MYEYHCSTPFPVLLFKHFKHYPLTYYILHIVSLPLQYSKVPYTVVNSRTEVVRVQRVKKAIASASLNKQYKITIQ